MVFDNFVCVSYDNLFLIFQHFIGFFFLVIFFLIISIFLGNDQLHSGFRVYF